MRAHLRLIHLCTLLATAARSSVRSIARAVFALAFSSLFVTSFATAANLTIADDVVVKFGQDAGLTVRDGIQTGKRNVFTSLRDDSAAGPTGATAQTPGSGDWRGVKLEASALPASVVMQDLTLRFAGGLSGAALDLRKNAFTFSSLWVSDSIVGIRVTDGAAASFSGSDLTNNQTGMEVDRGAVPTITASEIRGNTLFGINNKTPSTIVQATGNWWGATSGPYDPVANPSGTGDKVSTGVNYGQYASVQPLFDCSLASVTGYTVSVPSITLALSCRNAASYRLSESTDFGSIAFTAMSATTTFTLSTTPGNKTIYAEYRGSGGNTLVVALPQPILYVPNVPTVALTAPAANAVLNVSTTIIATASDALSLTKVDFYVDDVLLQSLPNPPFSVFWNITSVANGAHTIKAIATNTGAQTATDTRSVTVAKVAPTIASVQVGGVPLVGGMTLTTAGLLTAQVSGPSGVASVQTTLDGSVVGGGNSSGAQYAIQLSFSGIANGGHTLTLTATDTFGDSSTLSLNFTLAIPAPAVPTITSPSTGATVRQASVGVAGTATVGSSVQLYRNGVANGSLLAVGSGGTFSGTLTLAGEGVYTITAGARDSRATSALSAPVQITYTIAAPTVVITSPAANATLSSAADFNVSVVDAVGIQSVVLAIDGTTVATLSTAPYTYHWDVTQASNALHTLSAVVTNLAGKTAQDARTVTVQNAPPPPPPVVTRYTGEVAAISPPSSYGEQPIVISGRAKDRSTGASVPNAALRIVLQVAGFQRKINIGTDAAGNFSFSFVPQTTDAGTYVVSVIHPEETTLPNLGRFAINRLSFSPTTVNLSAIRDFAQPFNINATASAGLGASVVHFQLDATDQPSGTLPAGISIDTSGTVNVPAGGSQPVLINFVGTASAVATGTVVLTGYAADSGSTKRGTVTINYRLADATPAVFPLPTYIETGVSQGGTVTDTLTLDNKGLIAATNVAVQLLNGDGSSPPSWIFLSTTGQVGTLGVGQQATVQLTIAPTASVNDGIYTFKVRVSASNASGGDIPVSVSVTQAGVGNVTFKVADIYTNTLNASGQPIPGLAGATLKVQNAEVLTVQQSTVSDATGQATIANLPTGAYLFRASAPNHTDASGRFQIRPGVTTVQNVFLDYNAITIEFAVTETTIVDHYNVTLTATYQTQVPAPVVLIEPLAVNLPDMQVGEEFTGEITITNYGLVNADNVVFTEAAADAYFKVEVYGTVPTTLAAKQRISLPYKVTALQALPGGAPANVSLVARPKTVQIKADTTGCYTYQSGMGVSYDFACANGDTRGGSTGTTITKAYGTCSGGGSSIGLTTYLGGGACAGGCNPNYGGGIGVPPAGLALAPACVPYCCEACNCVPLGSGPGGPPPGGPPGNPFDGPPGIPVGLK
jgi:large repetitive protein